MLAPAGKPGTPERYASAVVFHNGLGDYVLALPTLRALASELPRPSLLIAGRGPQEFIISDLSFDGRLLLPFQRASATTEFDWQQAARACHGCEVLVSVCPFRSESLQRLVEAVRPARTIGMGPPCAELVDYMTDTHECDALFGVVRRVQPLARIEPFASPLPSSTRSAGTAGRIRSSLPPSGRLLVAHVDSVLEKTWPLAFLDAALHEVLSAHHGLLAVVLNARSGDLPAATAGGRAACLDGLSLDRAMSLVAACDAFLGVDSCMLHAADLCRRPGVGLFGVTQARRFGFRWSPRSTVRELQAGRMSDHDPLEVAAAISGVLAAQQGSALGCHVTAG